MGRLKPAPTKIYEGFGLRARGRAVFAAPAPRGARGERLRDGAAAFVLRPRLTGS